MSSICISQNWTSGAAYKVGDSQIRKALVGVVNDETSPDVFVLDQMNLWILRGNGKGSFVEPAINWQANIRDFAIGRFNKGDKTNEIIALVADGSGQNASLYQLDAPSSTPASRIAISSAASYDASCSIVSGDFNYDGLDDLAIGCPKSNAIFVGINQGEDAFAFSQVPVTLEGTLSKIIAGDFDGDGNTDLQVLLIESSGNVARDVLWGAEGGSFTLQRLSAQDSNSNLAAGDFDGDSNSDFIGIGNNILTIYASSGKNRIFDAQTTIKADIGCHASTVGLGNSYRNNINIRAQDIFLAESCQDGETIRVFTNQASTQMKLSVSLTNDENGFTANITANILALSSSSHPEGKVYFSIDDKIQPPVTLENGAASIIVPVTAKGSRIAAVYHSSNRMAWSANRGYVHTPFMGSLSELSQKKWKFRPLLLNNRSSKIYTLAAMETASPNMTNISASPTTINAGASVSVTGVVSSSMQYYGCSYGDQCPSDFIPIGASTQYGGQDYVYGYLDGAMTSTAATLINIGIPDMIYPNCGEYDANTGWMTDYCSNGATYSYQWSTSSLSSGSHNVGLYYKDDGSMCHDRVAAGYWDTDISCYINGASSTVKVTVTGKSSPSLSLSCSPSSPTYGSVSVGCSPSVSGGSSPTGSIAWGYSQGGTCTPGTWVSGYGLSQSVGDWAGYGAGTITVCAQYSGDSSNNSASASTSFTIQKATPSGYISCSPNPITYGSQSTTCTAKVNSVGNGSSPSGSATMYWNGNLWGTFGLSGGSYSQGFGGQPAGGYTFTGSYNGDSNYNSVGLSSGGLTIQKAGTSTGVSCSPNPMSYGGSGTTCTISVGGTNVSGTATLYINGGAWNTGTLSNGSVSWGGMWGGGNTPQTNTVSAVYNGDSNNNSSSSGNLSVSVVKSTPSVSVSCTNPSYPNSTNCTVHVSSVGNGTTPTGSITFVNDGSTWGTVGLSNGSAVGVGVAAAGTHTMQAVYNGDSNYNSASTSVGWTESQGSSSMSLACSPTTLSVGDTTTCTANVAAGDGTVYFYWPTALTGEWWNGAYPSAGGSLSDTPIAITHDSTLNYAISGALESSWANAVSAPSGSNTTTPFYARWTGTFVSPATGTYTIGVNSDDGANVYVNGTQLVNNLSAGQSVASDLTYTQSGTISLAAGATNTIVVEYEQGGGDAGIQLLWTIPGASSPTLLGWGAAAVNSSGQASISGMDLIAGSSTVSAKWSGDTNYGSSSASTNITATAKTFSEISSSLNPATYGQSVTFSGIVDTGGVQPSGSLGFADSGSGIGTGTLSAVAARNLVPDSSLKYSSSYWHGSYSGGSFNFPIAQSVGQSGGNGFAYSGTGSSAGWTWNTSATIPVTAGKTYTLSAYIDATYVTSSDGPYWAVYDPNISTGMLGITVRPGTKGRVSGTFTVPAGISQLVIIADTNNITVPEGHNVVWSDPQLEEGSSAAPYILTDASARAGYGGTAAFSDSQLVVGTHPITAVYGGDSATGASTSTTVSQIITKGTPTLAASCTPNPVVYGGTYSCTATVSGSATGTVTWPDAIWGNSTTLSSSETTTGPLTATRTGTYSGTVTYNGDSNNNAVSTTVSLTVTKAQVTVTANDASMTYGGAVPSLSASYSGFVNGDNASALSGSPTLTTAATSGSAVGSYPISCDTGSLSAANYSFVCVNGTLTIGAASLTITPSAQSKVYGSTLSIPTTAFTSAGLKNSDSISSVTMTSPGTSATASAGSYAISAAGATGSGLSNYAIVYNTGALTVTKAVLTATANDASMTYGGAVPSLTATYSGFMNGDSAAVITGTPTLTTTATSGSPVGSYAISCGAGPMSAANYTFTCVNGTLTIGAATLTITPTDENKVYGSVLSIPGTAFSSVGLKNTDSISSVTMTSPGTASTASVGSYTISAAGAAGNGLNNYSIVYNTGTLTVGKAPLTVTASSEAVPYGAAVPIITPIYSGWQNSDNSSSLSVAPTCSTAYVTLNPLGSYATSCTGAASSNYTISYVPGAITVEAASVAISATSTANPSTYGQPVEWTFSVAASSGVGVTPTGSLTLSVGGTSLGSVPLSNGVATYRSGVLPAGTNKIVVTYSGDSLYR
jgi:hypothetical protein